MALIRDTKYVKTLARLTNNGDVMDDACRMILSDAELKLRVLICVRIFGEVSRRKILQKINLLGESEIHEAL